MNQTWENGKKPSFGPNLAQIRTDNFFFFKNLAPSFTRYHDQLASYKISEKTNDPILRKLLTDEQTEGQMDKSGFIGRCPTSRASKNIKLASLLESMIYIARIQSIRIKLIDFYHISAALLSLRQNENQYMHVYIR